MGWAQLSNRSSNPKSFMHRLLVASFTSKISLLFTIFLCAGILEGRRLIIVVTQFDRTYGPNNTGEEITVQEVYEKVCQLVSEACPDVKISCDDVLPVSGLWAYNARMLMSHPDGPEHDNYRRSVEWYLPQCQSLPCGQGQSWSSYFTDKSDDELAKQLLDVSGLASIEERYNNCLAI